MLVLPVVLVTSVLTALWWSVSVATITFPLRSQSTTGSLRPNTLYVGSPQSHIALSLGLTSPDEHTRLRAHARPGPAGAPCRW